MTRHAKYFAALLAAAALSPAALAQVNNPWVSYVKDVNRIKNPDGSIATQITNNGDEKHFAYGDFNNDGWTDLAIVTKVPASVPGMRRGYLLMNENGTLVDRTTEYGADADISGSLGLFDTLDYRKVKAVDVNGDGLLDLVTCATNLSTESSNPKYLSHPRVYINRGFDVGGNWLGFRYEDARIPALVGANGQLAAPRFCSVAAGDVTGDGFPDLYFVQYHTTETNYADNPNNQWRPPAHQRRQRLLHRLGHVAHRASVVELDLRRRDEDRGHERRRCQRRREDEHAEQPDQQLHHVQQPGERRLLQPEPGLQSLRSALPHRRRRSEQRRTARLRAFR